MPELTHSPGGVQPPIPGKSAERVQAAFSNRHEVELMLNYTNLPAPVITGCADAAYVTVADLDDLLPWLEARGGRIHVSPRWEGVQVWTLHTTTPSRADGSRTTVRVSAVAPVDTAVMPEVAQAVTA
jgi:hypothetical protein